MERWQLAKIAVASVAITFCVNMGARLMTRKPMKYFEPSEFGAFWPIMDNAQLEALDKFRELWGAPVRISPAEGALGRAGFGSSQHHFQVLGTVKAADVFPQGLTVNNAEAAYRLAKKAGFSGIGIYTDTQPGMMMHLDVREDRTPSNPAKWARVAKQYVPIEHVIYG